MKQCKWITDTRETLVNIYVNCDSEAAAKAEMTTFERLQIQKRLKELVGYIDLHLAKKR